MIADRTDSDKRTTGFWSPTPPIVPDVRSRWVGILPALLMAVVVAGPSVTIAWLILANPELPEDAPTGTQMLLFALAPALLVALLLIPSLVIGRWPDRLTAVRWVIWLVLAGLLVIIPGIGLSARNIVELPNNGRLPDRPDTISTWVVDGPGVAGVLAAIIGAVFIVGAGFFIGYWARERSRYVAVVAAAVSTVLGIVALAMYAIIDFGNSLSAHAETTPDATFVSSLPIVMWLAAPAVAVLAGAEFWAEEYHS